MVLNNIPSLEICNLHKKFGKIIVADGINIKLQGGKVYALIGPNGTGKTTILNIINGFLKPDKGNIYINGIDILYMLPYLIARNMRVGRLFQNMRIFDKMSVYENMASAKRYEGEENPITSLLNYLQFLKEEHKTEKEVKNILKVFRIPINKKDSFVENLSFGQQKLIALARLLMGKFDILLLDEPVAGVQPEVKEIIYQKIKELAKQRKLILIVEHEMEAVRKVANEVIFMEEGKVRVDKTEKILSDPQIIKEYIGIEKWKKPEKRSKIENNKKVLLKIENIYVSYNKMEVIKGVDIELKENEIVAMIGPNGAGKSTLLKVLAGVLKVKMGKIWMKISGKMEDITNTSARYRVHKGIGYFMQGGEVFPELTVKENLELPLLGLSKQEIKERIEEMISFLPEIKKLLPHKAGLLSGGEKQIVALGMILVRKPKILLWLDEPSAGLSPKFTEHLMQKIKKIKKGTGASILLVEQKIVEALSIADRVYILKHGKIEKQAMPYEITEEEIEKIYVGS